jgi:hypothetical protein
MTALRSQLTEMSTSEKPGQVFCYTVCASALQLFRASVQVLRITFRAFHELNERISLFVDKNGIQEQKNSRYCDISYNRCNARNQVLVAVIWKVMPCIVIEKEHLIGGT